MLTIKGRAPWILIATLLVSLATESLAAIFVSVAIAPPLLPVYTQPVAPGPGYIWTPGYWAYGVDGYFWVPGTWVIAPFQGALWTPGYWAWNNSLYIWRAGYWGPRVGFYGGVNYGFGYMGVGYQGGYWNSGAFYYNRAVNNVNVTNIQNTYNTTVVNNTGMRRVSYNGGTGGTMAQPTAAENAAAAEQHTPAIGAQLQHEQAAASNRALLASVNHGRPSIAATPQPGAFDHPGVVASSARNTQAGGAVHPQTVKSTANVATANVNTPMHATHPHPRAAVEGARPQGHPHAPQGSVEAHGEAPHVH